MKRREFLTANAAGIAGMSFASPMILGESVVGANDRLQAGGIGLGSRGTGDVNEFQRFADVTAVCDVDEKHLANGLRMNLGRKNADGQSKKPDGYKDYRHILDRKDIDIICISTVDHWHTKIAVEALQAGKHVFSQKPLTLTIEENKLIRAAAKKYGKTFTVSTQQRSQVGQFMTAILMVQKGLLGEVKHVVVHIDGSPTSKQLPEIAVPPELDWETWQGQTPTVKYRQRRVHYEYRWWYEYSGGKFTDWGAHHIDNALQALNLTAEGTGPISVKPILAEHPVPFQNGYPTVDDQYNTSNKFNIEVQFPNGIVMNVVSSSPDGNGILFEGTKGKIHVNRNRIKGQPFDNIGGKQEIFSKKQGVNYQDIAYLENVLPLEDYVKLYNGKPVPQETLTGTDWINPLLWNKQNFIRCIREGGLPISDVFSHLQTMNVCHLCAIAARLGREIRWDAKTETIIGDEQASTFLARERRKGYEIPNVG
jgi:predicted dehydrogenase